MNQVLRDTLLRLREHDIRVSVTYVSRYGNEQIRSGYIGVISDQYVGINRRSSVNTYSSFYLEPDRDVVKEIRATKGKRRKAGMYYEVYYRELPYVPTADGTLDMSATLKQLFASAA